MVEFSLESEAKEAMDEPPPLSGGEELSLDNNAGLEEYLKKPELAEYYQNKRESETFEVPSYELELLAISDFDSEPYFTATYISDKEKEGTYSTTIFPEEVSYKEELDYFTYNLQYSIDRTQNIEAQTLFGITEEMNDDVQKSTVLYALEREEKQIKAETEIYFLLTRRQFVAD